jgi:5-methylcytosine-specific restriction endonuclease McrA
MLFFEDKPKRKPVSESKRELLMYKQNGKCAGCGLDLKKSGVKIHLHHVGKSNRIDALELLCPNCHSKAHKWKTKKTETLLGVKKERVLIKKRMGKSKKKKAKPKKKSNEFSIWNL